MRVLVTGASGMLGGGVARALHDRGDDVTVLQRRPVRARRCRRSSATSPTGPRGAGPSRGQDAVVHLAAKVNVTGAWADYARANVDGTASVVAACRGAGVRPAGPRLLPVRRPRRLRPGRRRRRAGRPAPRPRALRPEQGVAERLALRADGPDLAVVAVRPHLVWGPGTPSWSRRIVERARAGRLPVDRLRAPR